MSLCPHHLLRSRFSAGLPSSVPQRSLRWGHWYRHHALNTTAARCIAHEASNSKAAPPGDISYINNDLNSSGVSPDAISNSHSSTSIAPSPSESQDADAQVPQLPLPHDPSAPTQPNDAPSFRRIRKGAPVLSLSGENTPAKRGVRPRIVYNKLTVVNGETTNKQRLVSPESLDLEKSIRAQSLFYNGSEVRQWRAGCTELYRAKFYKRDVKDDLVLSKLDIEDQWLLEKINTDCMGVFREAWEGLDKAAKAAHWKRLSLWLLQHSPEKALEFLLVTSQNTDKPVFIMVADSLIYLDAFHSPLLKRWERAGYTYNSVIETCLDPDHWPVLFLPQKAVRFYVKKVRQESVYRAYELAHHRYAHLIAETYLCFMRRFTEFGDVDTALEVLQRLQRLRQHDFSLNSEGIKRHCCKLLMHDSVIDSPSGRNFRILPKLLELGVRPDRDMMNVVLSNAFKTGDPQLGQDMLNFMKGQDLEPDSYTYLTLLSDAVSRGDRERVESLIHEINPRPDLRRNPWIASKIFHAHFLYTAKHADPDVDSNAIFYSMLDMYNQYYDLTPLKELSILPFEYTPSSEGENTPPSTIALYLMIATYLRCQKRLAHTQRVYSRFRSLVLDGHETVSSLAVTDHTYNEFLIAFRHDPRGLRPAVRLVEDMLQSAAGPEPDTQSQDTGVVGVKPTVRTWTLLLSAFVYNRQPLAAEKVQEMMAKHGVEYNMVSWNTIINGYANAQNIPEVANTIKAMEDEGFSIDAYTMKSLRYLRDPERLWVAIEELDKPSEPDHENASDMSESGLAEVDEAADNEQLLDQGLQRLQERMAPRI
ncbi:hypothetical protein FE257_010199 [Aspergillus nanangensis]|uniref:Pentatricopeptide repeat protein n=1 Tax=Aspergillus nanangensis TaxID=2582783 RepID=A0AAD4CJL1_ASPNN|nr:hypothetical protein FE257_010199 [Aspergillus nanangensis]